MNPPVIIGSAPSSGSTLLVTLLGRLAGVYQTDELSIFDKVDWFSMPADELHARWSRLSSRGYRRRHPCEMRPVFTNVADKPVPLPGDDYLTFVRRYMDARATRAGCHRWIEKTPANVFSFPHLTRSLESTPFVVIVRDARSVMRSLHKRGFSDISAVARWYLSNLAGFAVRSHPSVLTLRYEDLVTDPERELRRVTTWIDEPFDPTIIRGGKAKSKSLGTWSASPAEEISSGSLWVEGTAVSARIAAVMNSLRPTTRFCAELGLTDAPTPVELQGILGYGDGGLEPVLWKNGGLQAQLAKDVARYFAASLRHGMLPRQLPFRLV